MASIGSLVTLLSLASDAFLQQAVSYPSQLNAQTNQNATIPYTQHFERHSIGDSTPPVSQALIAAVYNGVFSPNLTRSASSITPYCPTGNCEFPDYASLAVCSNCHNVTSFLRFTHERIEPKELNGLSEIESNVRYSPSEQDEQDEQDVLVDIYNYSLPNGHSLFSSNYLISGLNISASSPSSFLELNSDVLSRYQSAATILNISVITLGYHSKSSIHTALDCVLSFCAKSYSGRESLGYFNETSLDVFDEVGPTIRPEIMFDIPSRYLPSISDRDRNFSVDRMTKMKLAYSLQATLSGIAGINDVGDRKFTNAIASGLLYNGVQNIEATLANIADALTNAIRGDSDEQVQGTVLVMEPFIQVQWLWLLYPFIVLTLSMVFLGLTVWRTWRSDVPSWRSSVLAVMEHGVNSSIQEDTSSDLHNGIDGDLATAAGKEKVGDLEAWAEEVSVRLRSRGLWGKGFGLTVT